MSTAAPSKKAVSYILGDGPTASLESVYTIIEPLGTPGAFGAAFKARHNETNELVAVKRISKAHHDPRNYSAFQREVALLRETQHPHVVRFVAAFEDLQYLYIVTELLAGGELFDRIVSQPEARYNEASTREILRQVVQAVEYLHSRQIAHCDLKPDNFVFRSADRSSYDSLVLIDFGHAKHLRPRRAGSPYMNQVAGTPYYAAPEVVRREYSEACDVWSIGVIAFVMLCGFPPFYADPATWGDAGANREIERRVLQGFTPEVREKYGPWFPAARPISAAARDLIAQCLQTEHARRPTATELLRHPWFSGQASEEALSVSVLESLRKFRSANTFKAAVLRTVVRDLSDADMKRVRQAFTTADRNGDQRISLAELRAAMAGTASAAAADAIFAAADANGDGQLDINELTTAFVHTSLVAKEERLWLAFRQLDVDGNGVITRAELRTVLGREEADASLAQVDIDGDGNVSYEEFLVAFMQGEEEERVKHLLPQF